MEMKKQDVLFEMKEVDLDSLVTLEETVTPALGALCGFGCVGGVCGLWC